MTDIKELIQRDRSRRIVGIQGVEHLINASKMDDVKFTFDCKTPYVKSPIVRNSYDIINSIKKIREQFPHNFNFDNVLIAGGFITSTLTNSQYKDIDIFIYGLTPDEATKKVEEIIHTLKNPVSVPNMSEAEVKKYISNLTPEEVVGKLTLAMRGRSEYHGNDYSVDYDIRNSNIWRNNNVISIGEFQIILRCYTSISEILHGFDLGSCAFGFDGRTIWMTELSCFAYKTGFNIVDLTRRSTSYEYRLYKYYNRGFGIIFPDLDVFKLKPNEYISKYAKIKFTGFVEQANPYGLNCKFEKVGLKSDYDGDSSVFYKLVYLNLYKILEGKEPVYHYGKSVEKLHQVADLITIRGIYKNLIRDFKEEIFNRKKLSRYLSEYTFIQIIEMDLETFTGVVNEKVKKLTEIIKKHEEDKSPITWRVDNPGSQLVGSFNPAIITPEEWYH
jgi:hypothetical protein